MSVADVIGEERPLRRPSRLDDEHRLGTLDHDHDHPRLVEDEGIARAQHRAARQRCSKLDAPIGPPPAVRVRPILPAKRDGVSRVRARRLWKLSVSIDPLDDDHYLRGPERAALHL